MKTILSAIAATMMMSAPATATAADGNEVIRLNQVAMYPTQEKVAVIEAAKVKDFKITDCKGKTVKVKTRTLRRATSPWSGKQRTVVDFSALTTPGRYVLTANGGQQSFEIRPNALREVTTAAIKSYYLMRSGCEIEKQYAGAYARPLGHADTRVMIHPSAASKERPAGSYIVSPLGWYDAGDFNKYIVNSAYSVAVMLLSYEQNRNYYDALKTNIPESNNLTADLLDELMYNLQWMLTMQDPNDGGVYHKLTTPNFEGFVMPTDCHQQRYVVQKSVTATYDFAAVMSLAARIFKDSKDYPTFSRVASEAAVSAYRWAEKHPDALYNQDAMNKKHQPAVSTGTYGDFDAKDEHFWAATELFILTKEGRYLADAQSTAPTDFRVPSWGYVAPIAQWEWILHSDAHAEISNQMKAMMLAYCDKQLATTATSSFQTPTGNTAKEYGWGCLAEVFGANGMTFLFANKLTGQQKYLTAATQCADYILGRNATGYCYVTGFGTKSPQHPHQRISSADGIDAPMPGLLVGGPNPGQQDKAGGNLTYPSNEPDESYLDEEGSYASNEIAINWNATLVALTGWLDALNATPIYTRVCHNCQLKRQAGEWLKGETWRNGFTKARPHESVNTVDFYEQYQKNPEQWKALFAWLAKTDLLTIEKGKHPIEGTSLVASVEDSENGELSKRNSESHRSHIDFQYVVKGTERFGIIDQTTSVHKDRWKPDVVHYNYDASKARFYDSTPDEFFIFFPSDWHIAKVNTDKADQHIRVIVIKVDYVE